MAADLNESMAPFLAECSNGAFFAELVAAAFTNRVAALASSSGGLVRCQTTLTCGFQAAPPGRATTCVSLRTQRGWCSCGAASSGGAEKPTPVPVRMPPAYLAHGTADPLVSVQYTCELEERLQELGVEVLIALRAGGGHDLPSNFVSAAWRFLGTKRLRPQGVPPPTL